MHSSASLRWAPRLSNTVARSFPDLLLSRPKSQLPCHPSIASISSWHGFTSSSRSWSSTCSRIAPLLWHLNHTLPPHRHSNRTSETDHRSSKFVCPSYHRHASSSASWVTRQKSDRFAREAKVANLKSRAAFKLLQINERYHLFRPGQTVVDLGFAPGSWSQVAIELVRPGLGRVVGVDLIPVAPPRGVNAIQGDFLSAETQARVRDLLKDENAGRVRRNSLVMQEGEDLNEEAVAVPCVGEEKSYVDDQQGSGAMNGKIQDENAKHDEKCVDVVLSDMSAPWEILTSSNLSGKNSLSNPYYRMMNTSGNRFKDHAGSMDLCRSALYFAYDTLKIGGHFVCKFYQGAEDKTFEKQLKAMFHKVHREKPESSRSESKESFFVGIRRLAKVDQRAVFDEGT